MITRVLTVLCGALILGGCATLSSDFEPPTVSVASFRALPANDAGLNFEIGLKVVNPNPDPLPLRGVAYTIDLEGRTVVSGAGNDLPTIGGYSEETITLTASAGLLELMQLLGSMMVDPPDSLDYELSTKLDIGALYPPVRLTETGQLDLRPQR